jgi:hypothetical protein
MDEDRRSERADMVSNTRTRAYKRAKEGLTRCLNKDLKRAHRCSKRKLVASMFMAGRRNARKGISRNLRNWEERSLHEQYKHTVEGDLEEMIRDWAANGDREAGDDGNMLGHDFSEDNWSLSDEEETRLKAQDESDEEREKNPPARAVPVVMADPGLAVPVVRVNTDLSGNGVCSILPSKTFYECRDAYMSSKLAVMNSDLAELERRFHIEEAGRLSVKFTLKEQS